MNLQKKLENFLHNHYKNEKIAFITTIINKNEIVSSIPLPTKRRLKKKLSKFSVWKFNISPPENVIKRII